jgi:glycosyltransferase involved in cell wall biosynthesis
VTKGLSIVICTYNGVSRLGLVLDYISKLHIPDSLNWEVIIVDNASTDGTLKWIEDNIAIQLWNYSIKTVSEPRQGLNIARLCGALNSTYDWLLFCDDDNLLASDYVICWFNELHENLHLGCVGGRGIPLADISLPDWFNEYGHSYAIGPQYSKSALIPLGGSLYGAGLFVYKLPILKLVSKGFVFIMSDRKSGKLTSGGDLEWCYLIQLSGYKMLYIDEMTFQHQIVADRLRWSYYLRLKEGIASGAGLLDSYHFIFKRGYNNSLLFLSHYIINAIKHFFTFLLVFFKSIIFPGKMEKRNVQLARIILRSKYISYFSNIRQAYFHYLKLNKIFLAQV